MADGEDYVTGQQVLQAASEPGRIYSDRRIVMMLLKAAKKPEWALANFYAHLMPHWSHQQLANFLGIKRSTLTTYLREEVTEDIYDLLPKEREEE